MKTFNLEQMKRRDLHPKVERKIEGIVVHHSASSTDTTVKQIHRWHTIERGWSDIGYHFVITADGTINECRPLEQVGAHAKNFNKHSIGICVTGNTNEQPPNNAQLTSLYDLLEALRYDFGLVHDDVYTHREKGQTECPGLMLHRWVQAYRMETLDTVSLQR